jgi:hypothetical protein
VAAAPWAAQDVPLLVAAGRQRHEVTTLALPTRHDALRLLNLCQRAKEQQGGGHGGDAEAILECAFAGAPTAASNGSSSSSSGGGWRVVRARLDKRKPNALSTAWRCMEVGARKRAPGHCCCGYCCCFLLGASGSVRRAGAEFAELLFF